MYFNTGCLLYSCFWCKRAPLSPDMQRHQSLFVPQDVFLSWEPTCPDISDCSCMVDQGVRWVQQIKVFNPQPNTCESVTANVWYTPQNMFSKFLFLHRSVLEGKKCWIFKDEIFHADRLCRSNSVQLFPSVSV